MSSRAQQQEQRYRRDIVEIATHLSRVSLHEDAHELRAITHTLLVRVGQIEELHAWWSNYHTYMASEGWQHIRQKKLRQIARRQRRTVPRCERCRRRTATHVHHLTYERFGHELLRDLQALCSVCHDAQHRK